MNRLARRTRAATSLASLTLAAMSVALPFAGASGSGVPFNDTNVRGFLTFCGRDGQAITSGSLDTRPFAWKTLSSAPAPAGYRTSIARATLYVYQPIQFVDPGDWSGAQLTGSSSYANPEHPVAQATNDDEALLGFTQAYPSHWDGLVEVRMYFSSSKLGQYSTTYPAAIIRVTGSSWTLVKGGGSSCSAGQGVSDETNLLPKKVLAKRHTDVPAGSPTPSSVASSATPGRSGGASPGSTGGATNTAASGPAAGSSSAVSSGTKLAIGLGIIAVLGVIAGGVAWWRRQPGQGA